MREMIYLGDIFAGFLEEINGIPAMDEFDVRLSENQKVASRSDGP